MKVTGLGEILTDLMAVRIRIGTRIQVYRTNTIIFTYDNGSAMWRASNYLLLSIGELSYGSLNLPFLKT